MVQSLYELLQQCTVRVMVYNQAQGTGFFVAPGLILTCAHVVKDAHQEKKEVTITWKSQTFSAQIHEVRDLPYPDIALLQVDVGDHPCVSLEESAQPFDKLYGYGYPDDYPLGDSVTLECEGWTNDLQPLLKLKRGQVRPGLSGAPLLNIRTGRVCGIIKRTRDQDTDLGGRAIPTKIILQEFVQLPTLQQAYHSKYKVWLSGTTKALEVFYSYAHKDEDLRQELDNHLSLLRRQGLISRWYDRKIEAGSEFSGEINSHLNTAHIILLLISPSFMGSDYCYDTEMMRAMERHETRDARVVPVILRPTDWHSAPFGKLMALPHDGKAIVTWTNKDEAFLEVARGMRKLIETLTSNAH